MNRTAVIYPALVVIIGGLGLIVLAVLAWSAGPSDDDAQAAPTAETTATAAETEEPDGGEATETGEEPEATQAPETEEPTEAEESPADEETATEEPTDSADDGDDAATELTITAVDLLFDETELRAPANTEITVVLVNEDAGMPHNIAFYQDDSASEAIAVGDLFPGPETRELTFTTPGPGTYFFRCDIHPGTMIGDLIVE